MTVTHADIVATLTKVLDWGGRKTKVRRPWHTSVPSEVGLYVVAIESSGDALEIAIGFFDGEAWTVSKAVVASERIRYWMKAPPILSAPAKPD